MSATAHIFVGRDRELEQLCAGVAAAGSGRGQLMLLSGPAGIGKTRIAEEVDAHARSRGASVLWGRCWEGDGAPSFWPWVQALRTYVRDSDPTTLRHELGQAAAPLAELVDAIRTCVPDLPVPAPLDPEQARFRLFDSVATFLASAARRRPLVLILDDLHWADIPSLHLLRFVAQEARSAGLLLIGTVRDPELPPDDPVMRALAALGRAAANIHLHGLSLDDVGRLAESVSGSKPEPQLIEQLHRRTEGNPYFTGEIVRLWVSEGRRGDAADVLPSSVRQTLRRRVDRLSPGSQRLLSLAAVVGHQFSRAVLERALPATEECGATRVQILDCLDEAAAQRLIEAIEPREHYRFAHTLVRDTLYEDLGSARREALHRAVGAAIEAAYARDLDAHLAELAHHFVAAAPSGDRERTVAYARRAGERALRLMAYEDAAAHFRGALRALELTGADAQRDSRWEQRRCELFIALGEAYARAGDGPAAHDAFRQAVVLGRRLGASDALSRAVLGLVGADVTTRVEPEEVALLEEALAACGEHDSPLRARLLSRLATGLYFSDEPERRRHLSRTAVAVAERLGDTETLASVLSAQHFALWGPDDPSGRLAIATRIITLSEHTSRKDLTLRGHFWRLVDALELGDIAAVDHAIRCYTELAEQLRLPYHIWRATTMSAMQALLEGRFADGERLVEQAFALGARAKSPNAALIYGVQLYGLRREQGRLQELEPVIAAFAAEHAAIPAFRCGLALLYCELGRLGEARGILDRLAASGFDDLPRDNNWLNAMDELAQVCVALDEPTHAATLYQRLLPFERQNVVVAFADACDGAVARYLGLLAATLSRWDEAARHFEIALEMNQRIRARPFLAHTQREYAQMLLRRRGAANVQQARELLAAACTLYADLGMLSYREQAKALAASALPVTAAPGSVGPGRPTADPDGHCFERSGEFWTLTYAGRTTRLRDAKGLRYLAHLLREPGREFHVADLARASPSRPLGAKSTKAGAAGSLGIVDARAKSAYRQRLTDLRSELEEADRFNDPERASRAHAEIEAVTAELQAAYGGHASRRSIEPLEKTRKAVTNCIRDVLRKLQREHEPLWRHLYASIHTGTFCSYHPENPTRWAVSD